MKRNTNCTRHSFQPTSLNHTTENLKTYLLREDVCVHGRLNQGAEPTQLPPAREKHTRHVPQKLIMRACLHVLEVFSVG